MPLEGTLEVITDTPSGRESTAQRVKVAALTSIPAVLANNFSMTVTATVAAVKVGSVTSAGAWTGTRNGQDANARLWLDIPFEQTAIGKALVAGEIDPLNPDGA